MKLKLTKCHGSGNDFLLIDELHDTYNFTDEDRQNLAISLCDRQEGLGADGILFVLKSETCDAKMRVFNADGSEASMCGNGLRCVGRYVCESLNKENIVIETMKANLNVSEAASIYEGIPTYKVEISPVLFDLNELPMNLENETLIDKKVPEISDRLHFTAVAVPNPHLISIVKVENIVSNEQKCIAESVNGPNNLFPDGVNVSFVHPIDNGAIYVRTFERGVGFTNACGTAMSASSLVTCLLELNEFNKEIEVYNNGGKVRVIVNKLADGKYNMDLIGNATYLYDAEVDLAINEPESYKLTATSNYTEQEKYELLEDHAKKVVERKVFLSA